jgi:hypothetical protein
MISPENSGVSTYRWTAQGCAGLRLWAGLSAVLADETARAPRMQGAEALAQFVRPKTGWPESPVARFIFLS